MRRLLAVIGLAIIAFAAWTVVSGHASRLVLSVQILDELRRPGPASWLRRATPEPSVSPTVIEGGGRRFAADVYRPGSGRFASPLLFVPGMVPEGKDEPRVAPFARMLARAGYLVICPDLPSFRALRVHPDNETELEAALDGVLARRDLAPRGRCGLLGVSFAGGIAMLAALDSTRADRIRFVAAVGPFADIERSLQFLATGQTRYRGKPHRVTPGLYGRLVFLRTFEEFLVDAGDRDVLELMAARRTTNARAPLGDLALRLGPEGRTIYDLFETASPEQVPSLIARLPQPLRLRMAELSPERRDFEALRSPVFLVHARDDDSFPVDESVRIAALARPHVPTRLVVMEALHHVDPEPWREDLRGFLTRDVPEAARLVGWWSALLALRDSGR
jgi:pimeloyl-ACP methyl ester carboxylesterase